MDSVMLELNVFILTATRYAVSDIDSVIYSVW